MVNIKLLLTEYLMNKTLDISDNSLSIKELNINLISDAYAL